MGMLHRVSERFGKRSVVRLGNGNVRFRSQSLPTVKDPTGASVGRSGQTRPFSALAIDASLLPSSFGALTRCFPKLGEGSCKSERSPERVGSRRRAFLTEEILGGAVRTALSYPQALSCWFPKNGRDSGGLPKLGDEKFVLGSEIGADPGEHFLIVGVAKATRGCLPTKGTT